MTSPSTTAGVTNPYTLNPGDPPVRISDGTNNSPAGLTLTNRGDNGGTVWIMGGPNGQAGALPLGPGASLQWSDVVNLPYAYLSTGAAKAETLVVSSQSGAYTNPTVVSAALVAQGIPSTMLDTGYGTTRLAAGQANGTTGSTQTGGIQVGQSSTLIVSVSWPQPTPLGANVVRLAFDDPSQPDLPPSFFYLTNNNAVEQGNNVWQVPVVAPRLVIANLQTPDNNNADAYVSVVGNNRQTAGGFRMIAGGIGTKTLFVSCPTVGMSAPAQSTAGDYTQLSNAQGTLTGLGPMTRFTGLVTVTVTIGTITGNGIVSPTWVDETGRINSPRQVYVTTATQGPNEDLNDFTFQWVHPPVPVYWRYDAFAANAGSYMRVTVNGAP